VWAQRFWVKKIRVSQAIIASSDESEEAGMVSASIPQPMAQVEPPERSPQDQTKMSHGIETASSKAESKRPDSDFWSSAAAKLGASILEHSSKPKNEGSYVM
jgi:hypothetical protein